MEDYPQVFSPMFLNDDLTACSKSQICSPPHTGAPDRGLLPIIPNSLTDDADLCLR